MLNDAVDSFKYFYFDAIWVFFENCSKVLEKCTY